MISSSTWVPRGFASEFPEKYELNDEEMERINAMANLELNDAKEELQQAQEQESSTSKLKDQLSIDDDLKEYNLESYDDEIEENGEKITMFPGLSNTGAQYHQDEGEEDVYLSLPTEADDQEEKQENQIYPTDNLILATRTEDDISWLDIYIYDDGAGAPNGEEEEEDKLDQDVANGLVRDPTLYVHHDIMLPAFPLCVEWVNYKPGSDQNNVGNFAAVGTFDPQIEIWNLDFIDKAFPDVILGEPNNNSFTAKSNKKSKKKSKNHITTHHTDAILSLSHNKIHRSVLASTSADKTIKLWDLNTATAVKSFNQIHHNQTVSSSQWHSTESSILLTGGYDSNAALTDVRSDNSTKYYNVGNEEVENVKWKNGSEIFYVGTDQGNLYCFDIKSDKPLWTLKAHDSGISSLDVNNFIGDMIVTSAMSDRVVKLWKCQENQGPSMILGRDFGLGNVLTSSFANDIEVGGNLVVGGVTAGLKMWDTFSNSSIRNSFKSELKQMQQVAKDEAKSQGKASRIARKYQNDQNEMTMTVEAGGDDSDEEIEPVEGEEEEDDD